MRALSQQQLESEICSFVTSLTGQPCAPDTELKELGVDSIAFLEVVIFVEKKLSIPLPLELITSRPITTVAALVTHLQFLTPEKQGVDT
jgi:acyl carrier protein